MGTIGTYCHVDNNNDDNSLYSNIKLKQNNNKRVRYYKNFSHAQFYNEENKAKLKPKSKDNYKTICSIDNNNNNNNYINNNNNNILLEDYYTYNYDYNNNNKKEKCKYNKTNKLYNTSSFNITNAKSYSKINNRYSNKNNKSLKKQNIFMNSFCSSNNYNTISSKSNRLIKRFIKEEFDLNTDSDDYYYNNNNNKNNKSFDNSKKDAIYYKTIQTVPETCSSKYSDYNDNIKNIDNIRNNSQLKQSCISFNLLSDKDYNINNNISTINKCSNQSNLYSNRIINDNMFSLLDKNIKRSFNKLNVVNFSLNYANNKNNDFNMLFNSNYISTSRNIYLNNSTNNNKINNNINNNYSKDYSYPDNVKITTDFDENGITFSEKIYFNGFESNKNKYVDNVIQKNNNFEANTIYRKSVKFEDIDYNNKNSNYKDNYNTSRASSGRNLNKKHTSTQEAYVQHFDYEEVGSYKQYNRNRLKKQVKSSSSTVKIDKNTSKDQTISLNNKNNNLFSFKNKNEFQSNKQISAYVKKTSRNFNDIKNKLIKIKPDYILNNEKIIINNKESISSCNSLNANNVDINKDNKYKNKNSISLNKLNTFSNNDMISEITPIYDNVVDKYSCNNKENYIENNKFDKLQQKIVNNNKNKKYYKNINDRYTNKVQLLGSNNTEEEDFELINNLKYIELVDKELSKEKKIVKIKSKNSIFNNNNKTITSINAKEIDFRKTIDYIIESPNKKQDIAIKEKSKYNNSEIESFLNNQPINYKYSGKFNNSELNNNTDNNNDNNNNNNIEYKKSKLINSTSLSRIKKDVGEVTEKINRIEKTISQRSVKKTINSNSSNINNKNTEQVYKTKCEFVSSDLKKSISHKLKSIKNKNELNKLRNIELILNIPHSETRINKEYLLNDKEIKITFDKIIYLNHLNINSTNKVIYDGQLEKVNFNKYGYKLVLRYFQITKDEFKYFNSIFSSSVWYNKPLFVIPIKNIHKIDFSKDSQNIILKNSNIKIVIDIIVVSDNCKLYILLNLL